MSWEKKYLKYKKKYLALKALLNIKGGAPKCKKNTNMSSMNPTTRRQSKVIVSERQTIAERKAIFRSRSPNSSTRRGNIPLGFGSRVTSHVASLTPHSLGASERPGGFEPSRLRSRSRSRSPSNARLRSSEDLEVNYESTDTFEDIPKASDHVVRIRSSK